MVQSKHNINDYKLKIAYPTIVLTLLAFTVYIIASIATYQGYLGIGWGISINALVAYLLFTSMHEAGHLNISGNHNSLRWIDEIIGWLSGIPLFAPFYVFKVIHFRHHAYTNDPEKDPDHWLASKNLFSLLFHSTTIFPVYLIKGGRLLFSKERIPRKVRRELKIGFIGLFLLLTLLTTLRITLGWAMVLQLWIVPAFIAQVLLAFAFDWLPHHPHEEKARFLNTRVFDIPGLRHLLLGQNYHLIHHLHPRIPFYDYKKVYLKIKEELKRKGVDIISLGHS
jgi:fatty acid desaturase